NAVAHQRGRSRPGDRPQGAGRAGIPKGRRGEHLATGETSLGQHDDHPDESRVLIHDLRNLLAVIVNYRELIAAEPDDPEAVKADIAEIRMAADRAIALSEKLPRRGGAGPAS